VSDFDKTCKQQYGTWEQDKTKKLRSHLKSSVHKQESPNKRKVSTEPTSNHPNATGHKRTNASITTTEARPTNGCIPGNSTKQQRNKRNLIINAAQSTLNFCIQDQCSHIQSSQIVLPFYAAASKLVTWVAAHSNVEWIYMHWLVQHV
jgi:hypothetical protein